ncbi:NADH:ubiquinone oxidoreductase subunit NDUFA12 [Hyphobacterium sp. CCMP332]|jgi:NADH:ubiquinone oxidoreductase subunit|uniref:NADH:ubiquinone oxidoreductase subunit NDUFA12 n=1 Tax=Hyphobacterium sp. CCMP332 TaxID=2749086 RepID=UPI00164F40B1|nr:NADH:ubiquinone oxidoreductase subunit NDUFA12 [Hyphobacterium sp. CCMP332]QNL18575.1 NADH:ubiquinone oxidoreductase subunit NDUFA12 [Hyphobacterium sp. CCMP332]
MLGFIGKIFAWWDDATPGTYLTLFAKGATKVGEDEFGNRYFEEKKATGSDGRIRRYVVYNGYADASRVPMAWHGWLHHTYEDAPTGDEAAYAWEKGHEPNLTGTLHAYKPAGALSRGGKRQANSADYESWSPEG